jgi:hypothetical protein
MASSSSAAGQAPFVQSGEPLNEFLRNFWQRQVDAAEQETPDYRHPPLPLARIKKVMKSDPDVKVSFGYRFVHRVEFIWIIILT